MSALTRDLPVAQMRKAWRNRLLRNVFIALGLIGIVVAIWFGFPMTGLALLAGLWLRLGLIVALLGVLALVYGLRWRRHRRAAAALEQSLLPPAQGDGAVLAERMAEAMAKLKRAGGKTSLYDLPWYVIIGPPGAGKTTALRNAGIEFPGQEGGLDPAAGFGGTRNCDWWFAEDAVLLDTAGRYTLQDSDAEADAASWAAFLDLLKKGRPDQPINGVILAFSVEDLMRATPESLADHAGKVRARLAEIHETLRIDVPVYVLFTKADLIAGFREYFGSFGQVRRRHVWGVTFPTRDRAAQTHAEVPARFDTLLARLSAEVIDRLTEEPDATARIAIFGLPGQMAMLRDSLAEFLRRVFEPTRYKSAAILRGFYFTSGTQEGNPIDQVLGALAREGDGQGFQPDFLSGRGKSFFLHDLLKRVIFAERDWVGYDRRAVRRRSLLRSLTLAAIGLVTFGAMAIFAYSFWQNAALMRAVAADMAAYRAGAQAEIDRQVIDNPDPLPALDALGGLRAMTAGYGDSRRPGLEDRLGLSRYGELHGAARRSYSDALERMLRPRMVLQLETELPQRIAAGDTAEVYRALKVYLLLGGQGSGDPARNDAAVRAYFDTVWRAAFPDTSQIDEREALSQHLAAMLELDGDRKLDLSIDAELVRRAREVIVTLPLAEQAYASIRDRAREAGLADVILSERLSGAARGDVLVTGDGSPLDQLVVPGLFSFEGYWGYFLEETTLARDRLNEDQWVLGEAAARVGFERQMAGLERELNRLYGLDFTAAWSGLLDRLALGRMSLDPPRYEVLAQAASPVASPLLTLVETLDAETRLTRLYDQLAQLEADPANLGNLGGNLGDAAFSRLYARSGVFQRIVMESLASGVKSQNRAGAALAEDSQRRQVERITADFADWHALLKGEPGARPIDAILANLRALRESRVQAAMAPTPMDDTMLSQSLSALTMNNTALPVALGRMLNGVEREFRGVAQDANLAQLERALNDDVTAFCREFIEPMFPFGNGRHLSPAVFSQFFGPGGNMDRFYTTRLQPFVQRGPDGLVPLAGSSLGERLSPATLRQFDRAQAIRMAFFATGSPDPLVDMSVSHVSSSPSVREAMLTLNGAQVQTRPNSAPAPLSWPGQASGVTLSLDPPERGRDSVLAFNEGRWDIVNFLRRGRARVAGNTVEISHEIGGRSITYRIEFNSTTVPFLMPELAEFRCPSALE